MPLRAWFQPDPEQLAAAQWEVVDHLCQAIRTTTPPTPASQTVQEWLVQAYEPGQTPTQWATRFAQTLLAAVAALQAASAAGAALQEQHAALLRLVEAYRNNPPPERFQACQASRDHWYQQATRLARDLQAQQAALAAEQQAHQADVAHLQQQVRDLNRIVAQQQTELLARRV